MEYHRHNQSLYGKVRAKMAKCIYKTDILWLFIFISFFGMLLHFMAFQYEPPDMMSSDISPQKQQMLIDEFIQERKSHQENESNDRGFGAVLAQIGLHDQVVNNPRNKEVGILLRTTLTPSPVSELAVLEKYMKNDSTKLDAKQKLAKYQEIRRLLRQEMNMLLNDRAINSDHEVSMDNANAGELFRHWNERNMTYKTKNNTVKPAHLETHRNIHILNNTNPVPKFLKNMENETDRAMQMLPDEREKWFDEQAKEILDFMFINKNTNDTKKQKAKGNLHGGKAQCTLYDTSQAMNTSYECLNMDVIPTVKVCLYPSDVDIHISKHIREEGMWEPHIVKEFQNLLYSRPNYGFIDIGANIGVYSLVAATMGHNVVAVEPFVENLKHLHQAVQIGNLSSKITALRNAVYEERRQYLSLQLSNTNQGGIAVDPSRRDPCLAETCTNTVGAIIMDDLLEVINFDKALIKIDIEGFEHRAFRQSAELFDRVKISHIIMEWIKLRAYYGSDADSSPDKTLVFKLVEMLFSRGFRPFSLVTGIELKRNYWYAWPDDIIWKNDLEFAFD